MTSTEVRALERQADAKADKKTKVVLFVGWRALSLLWDRQGRAKP